MSKVAGITTPTISAAERALRLDAVRQATATIRLEGGVVSPEDRALDVRFIDGEIDLDAYVTAHLPLGTSAKATVEFNAPSCSNLLSMLAGTSIGTPSPHGRTSLRR